MDGELGRYGVINPVQELAKFDGTMAPVALANDFPCLDDQGRKE